MVKSLSISVEDREKMDHLTLRATASSDMKPFVVLTVGASSIVVEQAELMLALAALSSFQKQEHITVVPSIPEQVFPQQVDLADSLFSTHER